MKKLAAIQEDLMKQQLEEDTTNGFEVDKDMFNEVLEKFRSNNKRNYDFLIKASEDFQEAVFLMCTRFVETEQFPKKFQETTLHQIWKRKPGTRKEDLTANRYIYIAKSGCQG